MFQLSDRCEFMYCIDCGRNDMVLTATNGTKFHYYGAVRENVIEAVECHGPFAYSDPPEKHEEMMTLYSNMGEQEERELFGGVFEPANPYFEQTDIEQLAQLAQNDKYFPSIAEILIDNIAVRFQQFSF